MAIAEALEEARGMTDGELRKSANAGTSSSYYIRDGDRMLPMKAVLRLAYIREGMEWDGPQSKWAFNTLRDRFPVVYRPARQTLIDDNLREREWVERIARPGQSDFRQALIARDGACALTGLSKNRFKRRAIAYEAVVPPRSSPPKAVIG